MDQDNRDNNDEEDDEDKTNLSRVTGHGLWVLVLVYFDGTPKVIIVIIKSASTMAILFSTGQRLYVIFG